MIQAEDRYIVNALVRQALTAIQEVMGENGLKAVLRSSGLERFVDNMPPNDLEPGVKTVEYAQLNQAVEDFYGRGGRGFLHRIGKASFQYGLKEQSALMGLAGVAMKVLPHKQRINMVLNSMANALKKSNDQVDISVEEGDGAFYYIERSCGVCAGRTSTEPICHLYIGSLGEAVRWATGKDLEVTETHCTAKGDDFCRFEIKI